MRSFRDLKARLDRIDARSGGDYHTYNSFEAVSRKLADSNRERRPALDFARCSLVGRWPSLSLSDSAFSWWADSCDLLVRDTVLGV